MRRTITFIALLLVALSVCADVVDGWRRDQEAIEAMLQQKQYAEARKASIKLDNRMFDRLGANADASKMLALTVALRAAAEDGLGNADDTNWYRQVAKVLDPQIVLPPMTTPLPEPLDVHHVKEQSTDGPFAKTEPPESTRKRMPERPAIVNALGNAIVVLEVVIDVDGMVRQPRIVSSPAPSVSYAALEAVRQWRFRPGRIKDKPVPVLFHTTFNFH
jgi:TonB family protein